MFPIVQKNVSEWTPMFLSEFPFWELESQWTPEFLVGNCRGQNSLDWRVPYIIENLLDCRCLKWVLKTQVRAKKRVQSQIANLTPKSPIVGNCLESLVCRWQATYHWKVLNEGYNFAVDFISIGDLHTKLWDSKVAGVLILGLPLWSPKTKWHLGASPVAMHKVYNNEEGGGFPQSRPWWVLWVCVCLLFIHAPKMSSYALTNLLFGLYRSVWIIELLINLPSPHPEVPARPFTLEVLRAKERDPTLSPSTGFIFGLVMSSSKSLGVNQQLSNSSHGPWTYSNHMES
jgi:hypothetical protein